MGFLKKNKFPIFKYRLQMINLSKVSNFMLKTSAHL